MNKHKKEQLQKMQPTLVLGIGGSGFAICTYLKFILTYHFGTVWQKRIRILAFDTTVEPDTIMIDGEIISLEANSEQHNVGNVPIAGIRRNLRQNSAINDRYGETLKRVPTTVLSHGAKATRPLGGTAFYWHFPDIYKQIKLAMWALAGRSEEADDNQIDQLGLNIIVTAGLCGGTGSGMFIDFGALCRHLCNELGIQGEFSQISLFGMLPQAFSNVKNPHLMSNAGAALQELEHLMTTNEPFRATYPGGRTIELYQPPFDACYMIDGVDEKGRPWKNFKAIANMVAQALFMQIGTQLGRKGENAFDNLNQIIIGRNEDGEGTYLASIGLGTIQFPAKAVSDICANRLLLTVLREQWLKRLDGETLNAQLADQVAAQLHPVRPEQLTPQLLHHPVMEREIRIDLYAPEMLTQMAHDEVADEAVRMIRGFDQRMNDEYGRIIQENGRAILLAEEKRWRKAVNELLFSNRMSMTTLNDLLSRVRAHLSHRSRTARSELSELSTKVETQATTLNQAESLLYKAADSFIGGRKGRIRNAVNQQFTAATTLYELQLQQMEWHARLDIWTKTALAVGEYERAVQQVQDRLRSLAQQIETTLPEQMQAASAGGVSRVSLGTTTYINQLYDKHAPARIDLLRVLEENGIDEPFALTQMTADALHGTLQAAVSHYFAPIHDLTIEDVISAQAETMTPMARREQLFRLATPSWNINRARLPNGGADLVRIEVMGVPNDAETAFASEELIVSTHDPHEMTALVVTAGAPQSALQQYDLYERAVERVKSHRALYVLPHFMTDGNEGRLAFALGSIFGLIYTNVAWFYYQPVDELDPPVKLAQGLDNAITQFISRDDLVKETMERIDGRIAQMGLQQAIDHLTRYYSVEAGSSSNEDEITRSLKVAVRDYTAKLEGIQQFGGGLFAGNNGSPRARLDA